MQEGAGGRLDTRAKIIGAAAQLLRQEGPSGVTTRRVAEQAGVQAPAIYRLFGDKDGLLEAVAEHVMATYVAAKGAIMEAAVADAVDPLDELRAGWDMQIDFGVANPDVFRLLSDPERVRHSPSARSGRLVLEARVHRVALAGRLRTSERRCVDLIQAAGIGTIQALLSTAPSDRDPGLADAMFEAVRGQILTDVPDRPDDEMVAGAIALRAVAPHLAGLSGAERQLMAEWLDRAVEAMAGGPAELSTTAVGRRHA